VDVTDPSGTWNSSNGSFYVIRTFNSCTGPFGLFRVDGDAVLHWTGMNAAATGVAKLQPGSKLEQAPVNKRFTRIATGGYVTVEGNGSTLTSGSLSGSIAHTVNWITVGANSRTYQLSSDLNRKGYTPGGALVFNHHVKTPSHLDITADMTGKTWTASGTVQVDYVLVGVTVETTFSSLVIPMDDCMPLSGTANFIVSGNWTGSGTLTYNGDGTANYSYSYTNERGKTVTGSGTFAVSGCQ